MSFGSTERSVFWGNRCSSHSRTGSHHAAGLTAPCRPAQALQGHSVPLDADLHRSLRTLHFHLLSEATLVLLQPAEAFLIALQRTNHSAANDCTSCCQAAYHTRAGIQLEVTDVSEHITHLSCVCPPVVSWCHYRHILILILILILIIIIIIPAAAQCVHRTHHVNSKIN